MIVDSSLWSKVVWVEVKLRKEEGGPNVKEWIWAYIKDERTNLIVIVWVL